MEKSLVIKKYRKYDAEFKREALSMVSSGRTVVDVARSLGMSENLLYNWRTEQRVAMSPQEQSSNGEVDELRRQVRQLEQERDILKKALSIFSRTT